MLDSLQLVFTFCLKSGMLCSFKGKEVVSVKYAVKVKSVNKEDVAHIKAQFLRVLEAERQGKLNKELNDSTEVSPANVAE